MVASTYYRIKVTHTDCTTGTCTLNFLSTGSGDVAITGATLSSSNNGTNYFFGTSPADAINEVNFIPSTDFNGKITGISIYKIVDAEFTESTITNADTASTYRPVLVFFTDAFIGQGNILYKFDGTTATTALTFDTNENLIGLHKVGDQIVIYTTKKQYLWDGVALAPLRAVEWPNQTITQSINSGDNQLIVSKALNENYIWLSNGYSKRLLYRDSTNVGDLRLQIESAATGNLNNTTQNLSATFGMLAWILGTDNVMTYGKHFPDFPDSLGKQLSFTGTPTAIGVYNNLLYVATRNGTVNTLYSFPYIASSTFATSGYVDDVFIGTDLDIIKEFAAHRYGYYLPNSNCYLRYYAALDNETDKFSFIASGISTLPLVGATYTHNSSTYTVVTAVTYG